MITIVTVLEALEKPTKQNLLYKLRVNDCGNERDHYCDEDGYQLLLVQTEIYTLLHSKGCTEKEIEGVFERISTLQSMSFQDGVSEGIDVGFDQAREA